MKRYQVKVKNKSWDDPGPDLLRTQANAIQAARQIFPKSSHLWWRKQKASGEFFPWRHIGGQKAMTDWLKEALPSLNDGQIGQICGGTKKRASGRARTVVRGANIPIIDLDNATGLAEQAYSLAKYRFGDVRFGGAFVCKRISGTSSWSDHAWGDAVDLTEALDGSPSNDQIFNWVVRMAKENLLAAEMIIGSVNGSVAVSRAPSFDISMGGADNSHLWHTHISCRLHSGIPPCA